MSEEAVVAALNTIGLNEVPEGKYIYIVYKHLFRHVTIYNQRLWTKRYLKKYVTLAKKKIR